MMEHSARGPRSPEPMNMAPARAAMPGRTPNLDGAG
jgi:hypothetical protein